MRKIHENIIVTRLIIVYYNHNYGIRRIINKKHFSFKIITKTGTSSYYDCVEDILNIDGSICSSDFFCISVQTYGMKNSSGCDSSTYLNFNSGKDCSEKQKLYK